MIKLRFTGLTDPGLVRSANQDTYHVDPEGRFFVVADGMGGHAGGEEASRIATQVIQAYLSEHWDAVNSDSALLEDALFRANQAIVQEQQNRPERSEMGTTAVVVMMRRQPTVAHVGDSRLYRLRSAKLEQITEDHTLVSMAFKFGDLTPEQVRTHPYRHVLSRCLGRTDLREIDVNPVDIQAGDRLLLCSDGLTEELSDHLIASQLQSNPAIEQAVISLVNAANDNGGHDNITVVVVAIEE